MSALVLAYHRVACVPADPQALCVEPERFDEHLQVLRESFAPVPLRSIAEAVKAGRPPAGVTVTFDDGYADNAHSAAPALERVGIPATVFIATGYIGGGREFWWDELERLLLAPRPLPPALQLRVRGRLRTWRLVAQAGTYERRDWTVLAGRSPSPRHALYRSLCSLLKASVPAERERLLLDLRGWAGTNGEVRATHRPLDTGEAGRLAESGLVEIGAHTVEHPALSALPAEAQQEEIVRSRRTLEELLGRRVTLFSYPFGVRRHLLRRDYTARTIRLVRDAGFEAACGTWGRSVGPRSSLFELPRIVVRNWHGDELERRLRSYLGTRG